MSGKGSTQRPIKDKEKFDKEYERIFGKKEMDRAKHEGKDEEE